MLKKLKMHKNFWELTIEKIRTSPHIFINHCAVAICSFILSCSTVFGGTSPFGIAVISAIPTDFMYSALFGVVLGYIAGHPIAKMIRYIILVVSLRIFFSKVAHSKSNYNEVWFLPPVTVFLFTFLSGLIAAAFNSFNLKAFSLVLCESLVGAVSVYFFERVFEIKDINKGFGNMQTKDLVCILFCLGTLILTLSSFEVAEVSLANILSGFLILTVSFFGNEGAGTTIGVTSGIATGLYTSSLYDTVSLTFSGLLSGVFSPLGKAGCIISFSVARICVFLISGQSDGFLILILETVFSVILFSVIPQKLMPEIQRLFNISVKENVNISLRREISDKLISASECVSSISESLSKISDSLKKVSDSSEKSVYCFVQADVCKSCRKYGTCWDNYFSQTYKFFEEIADVFRENERVEKEKLPKKFVNSCIRTDELISSFEKNYRHTKSKREEELRVAYSRNMLCDQLDCMSKTLSNFSTEFLKETHTDISTAAKIKEILKGNGISVSSVNCPVSSSGVMKITALCRHIDSLSDKDTILNEIEKITLRKFEKPEIKYLENGIVLELVQKPWMSVEIGCVQYSSDGFSLCGDYSENFYDDGIQTIVISDGMGTGGRAAVDSAMTAEFFGKLIRSGFDEDTALKIVNSSMLVKSTYESLSTIDVAKIDLFTGKINFFKAGATVSFVRKNGRCQVIEGSSLPIGILREISFAKSSISVSPDDVVVMVSDGVTANGIERIKEEIEGKYFSSAQSLAQHIALKATENNSKHPSDDITVVVAMIKR